MTEAERKELEALKAKTDLTEAEKARMAELEAKVAADANNKSYSESYVKDLRNESAKYRTKAKEVEDQLAAYKDIDPEEFKRLKAAEADAQKKALEGKGDWDRLREQLVDTHGKELSAKDRILAEKDGEIERLKSEINSIVRTNEITVQAALAEAFNPRVVQTLAAGMTKVERLDGVKLVVRVIDSDGNIRTNIKTGDPMTVGQLFAEMKQSQDFAHLFKGGQSGAGSHTEVHNSKNITNPWKKESFNLTLQGEIYRKNPEQAARLKAEAESGRQ